MRGDFRWPFHLCQDHANFDCPIPGDIETSTISVDSFVMRDYRYAARLEF